MNTENIESIQIQVIVNKYEEKIAFCIIPLSKSAKKLRQNAGVSGSLYYSDSFITEDKI